MGRGKVTGVSAIWSLDDVYSHSKPPACLIVDNRHLDEKKIKIVSEILKTIPIEYSPKIKIYSSQLVTKQSCFTTKSTLITPNLIWQDLDRENWRRQLRNYTIKKKKNKQIKNYYIWTIPACLTVNKRHKEEKKYKSIWDILKTIPTK